MQNKVERPSKELYLAWRELGVTKFLVQDLFLKREELKEGLAEAQYGSTEEYERAVGRCMALKDAIDYIIRDFDYVDSGEEEENGD
jgi:hypothetical protein